MKPQTEETLRYLESLVDGLYADYTFTSDAGDISQAFVWNVETEGEFCFARLLEKFGLLKSIPVEEFMARWHRLENERIEEITQQCQSVFELVRRCTVNTEIYELRTFGDSPGQPLSDGFGGYDCVQFILGETQGGDWIGVAPKLKNTSGWTKAIHLQQDEHLPSSSASNFEDQIQALSGSLDRNLIQWLFVAGSPNDSISRFASVEGIVSRTARSKELIIETLLGAGNLLGVYPFEGFPMSDDIESELSAQRDQDDDTLAKYRQSKALKDFFTVELHGAKLYQLGYSVCIRHYIFAQLENLDWAGAVSFSVYS
jgi:hypothetical protein